MRDRSGLLEELSEGIAELTTSEQWTRYLEVQSRFYSYSANNVMLILLQNPDATRVAGYHAWQEMGRQVVAKESALQILAPMKYRKEDAAEGEKAREIRGFKFAPVFDIAQTEGPDLPEVANKLEGLAPEGVFEKLVVFAQSIGFRVERPESLDSGANGDTSHSEGRIRVVATNSEAQQAKTLAHEIGHALLHDPESPTTKDVERGRKELEAESTAYVICTALGLDTSDYSFGYVAGWAGGGPEAIAGVKESAGRIQKASTAVLRTFEVVEATAEVANVVGIEVAAGRSADMDTMLRADEHRIEDLVERERERDVTLRVESADIDRTHHYQPLSAAELEALDSVAHLNFDAGIGGRL